MPKIIDNLEQKLLQVAQRQIQEEGFSAMTIRSVAKECGVGVGTVYNYFPSKEALLATWLLKDWKLCVAIIEDAAQGSDPQSVVRCIYEQLTEFSRRHQAIFRDETAGAAFAGSFSRYHGLLRSQLAAPLVKFCPDDFTAEFVAESLLTWTMAGKPFSQIYGILERLF